jgi:hypothetical protein
MYYARNVVKKVHKMSDIARYERTRKDKFEMDYYQVISDPDPIGGFRYGAGISTTELEIMLRVDTCGFTPGTIIKKKTGEIFAVILGENEGLRLKAI